MPPELDWVLLSYRLPREPSGPRVAVWRKLQRLGVVKIVDGLVAAPAGPESIERLEWIAEDVDAAGGEAKVWLARVLSRGEARDLEQRLRAEVKAEYDWIATEAHAATHARNERERRRGYQSLRRAYLRTRKRDHFGGFAQEAAETALAALKATLDPTKVRS